MFISDDKMSLRIAEPEDVDLIYEWENDRRIWRVSETSTPLSRFQIEQFLMSNCDLVTNRQLRLMILHETTDRPVGCVDLFEYDPVHGRAAVGILIDESYRQQGYATQAIKLLMDYCFNNVMMHQLYCLVDEKNRESQHLFQRLGFQLSGRRKEWIKTPDGYIDVLFFQYINTL